MALHTRITAILALCAWTLAACANTAPIMSSSGTSNSQGTESAAAASAYSQFPDIPIPSGTKIDLEKTLVFGNDPWYGQLALDASGNAGQLFDFYRQNLSNYGWQEVTSVRAPTSILTYATADRVLAIAIQSGTITGSKVTVTVSPRGQPSAQPAPAPTGAVMPAPVQKLN